MTNIFATAPSAIISAVAASSQTEQSSALSMPEYLPLLVRIGVFLLIVLSVYNYLRTVYYGRIVEKILSAGSVSRDKAKSATELKLDSKFAKFWLRDKSTLRKLVHTANEEPELELKSGIDSDDQNNKKELNEEETHALKKSAALRPEIPFEKARFYIPEDKANFAQIRYCDKRFDRKGSPAALVIGCVLVAALGELFLRYYVDIVSFVIMLIKNRG